MKSRNGNDGRRNQSKAMRVIMPIIYLVLIGTIAVGIYVFVRAILNGLAVPPPQEVTVDNYVGQSINEVLKKLDDAGIPYDTPEYKFDDIVPKDEVISQNPLPNTVIKAGSPFSKLKLTVSKGRDVVMVPADIAGQEHTAMKYKLQDELGLVVTEKSEYSETVGANLVIRTEPAPNIELERGDAVTIYWSLGPEKKPVNVPDLRGLTYDEAIAKLNEFKLKLGKVYPEGRAGYLGKIIKQAPLTGETVPEDTPIDITFQDDTATPTPPGDNTGGNQGTDVTFVVPLPEGTPEGTVQLKIIIVNNATGDETIKGPYPLDTSQFPHPVVVPIPEGGGYTVKGYINDTFVKEQGY